MEVARALPPRASLVSLVWLLGLGSAGALVGACNALNGSGDFNIGEGAGSGPLPEGGSGSDGASGTRDGSSSGNDGGGPTDEDGGGVFNPDAGIDPKVKSCGANLVCLPDVGGWSPALFLFVAGVPSGGAACPPAYPQQNDLLQSGGGSCNCTCSASGGSCAGSVNVTSGAACAGPTGNLAVTADTCTMLNGSAQLPVAFTAHPSGPTPTSCGATVAPQLGKPRLARVCTGAVPSAGTCDAGELCVQRPMGFTGGLTCIVHDGNIACPIGLPFRTLVGTNVTDGRSCSNSCSCKQVPCGGTIEAFSDTLCATSVRSVDVDGTCITTGVAISGSSYRYTPSSGCGVGVPAKVLGTETYTAAQTLCCSF